MTGMIGKRRFVSVMTAIISVCAVEIVSLHAGGPGLSTNGQFALLGIMGAYFGFDPHSKKAENGKVAG